MAYFRFEFNNTDEETSALLVALLNEQGFEGFEETDENLVAFIPEADFDEVAFADVLGKLPTVSYIRSSVEQANWNAIWESGFQHVIIDDFVAIRASFHDPVPGVQHEIIITPKMSFGTGHHATTWMMVKTMGGVNFRDKQVLDFGTGTGVLAILAEKLGAAAVDAIDIDEWSISNAQENTAANGCSKIALTRTDHILPGKKYDVILANINLNVILQSLDALVSVAVPGTQVLLSGFLESDVVTMEEALQKTGFSVSKKEQKGEWVCLKIIKK